MTKKDKIKSLLNEDNYSYDFIALECDCAVSYVKSIENEVIRDEKAAAKPDPLTYFFAHNENINGVNYISKDDFLNYFK